MNEPVYVHLREMTEHQRDRFKAAVQKRIKKEAADRKREQKRAAKAEKELAAYLAKPSTKRRALQPFAIHLLKTRIFVAKCILREFERDNPVSGTVSEQTELVAKLALYLRALHDALAAAKGQQTPRKRAAKL